MDSTKRRLTALALAAGLGAPMAASAFGGGSCPPYETSIEASTNHANTVSTINARITQMETVLTQVIGQAANKIHGTIIDQTNAQEQMIQGQTDKLSEQLERLASYQAREQVEENFSDAPPVTVCREANAAGSSDNGEQTRFENGAARREGIDAWTRGRDEDGDPRPNYETVASGANIPADTLDTESILMADITAKDDLADKNILARRLVDFTPPEPLPASSQNTAHGVVYQSAANERQMRLAPSRSVIEERVSKTDPVYPADNWFDQMMAETGYANTSEGQVLANRVAENGDRVSYDLRQRLQVESRSMNSLAYQQRLNTLSGDELTRELIKQQAIANNLAFDALRLAQREAIMNASETAREVDQATQGRLDDLRVQAVSQPGQGDGG